LHPVEQREALVDLLLGNPAEAIGGAFLPSEPEGHGINKDSKRCADESHLAGFDWEGVAAIASAAGGNTMAAKKTSKKTARNTTKTKAKKAKPRTDGSGLALSAASPSLTVSDLQKSMDWYRDILGFKVGETWKDEAGKPVGAELKAGEVTFWIGQDDWKKGRDRKKGEGFRMFCMTRKSVDDIAKRITAKGGSLDLQPTDQDWGVREIALTDPDGFKITIAANRR